MSNLYYFDLGSIDLALIDVFDFRKLIQEDASQYESMIMRCTVDKTYVRASEAIVDNFILDENCVKFPVPEGGMGRSLIYTINPGDEIFFFVAKEDIFGMFIIDQWHFKSFVQSALRMVNIPVSLLGFDPSVVLNSMNKVVVIVEYFVKTSMIQMMVVFKLIDDVSLLTSRIDVDYVWEYFKQRYPLRSLMRYKDYCSIWSNIDVEASLLRLLFVDVISVLGKLNVVT